MANATTIARDLLQICSVAVAEAVAKQVPSLEMLSRHNERLTSVATADSSSFLHHSCQSRRTQC